MFSIYDMYTPPPPYFKPGVEDCFVLLQDSI